MPIRQRFLLNTIFIGVLLCKYQTQNPVGAAMEKKENAEDEKFCKLSKFRGEKT